MTTLEDLSLARLRDAASVDGAAWIRFGLACARFDWAAVDWAAIDWAAIDWTRFDGSAFDVARMRPPVPDPGFEQTWHLIREDLPGPRWQALFEATWPAYRAWFLGDGEQARPDLTTAERALRTHMPELVQTWRELVRLTGDDPLAARMLTLWQPPAFGAGCTSLVLPGHEPVLVRNYDWHPDLAEHVVMETQFAGRRVIGTSDCLWGLLDGMNGDGLVVSLTLGGRPTYGVGFAIPLVVRYLLETCATVGEARAALTRVPVAQAYNLTMADTTGAHVNAFVSTGEAPDFADLAVATNHRHREVEDDARAGRLRSQERQDLLLGMIERGADADELDAAFQRAPLYAEDFAGGFGTLYTARYEPARGTLTYRWPERKWVIPFGGEAAEETVTVRLGARS